MSELSGMMLLLVILSSICGISLAVVSSVHHKIVQRSIYADSSVQAPDARFTFLKNERKVERVLFFSKYALLTFTLLCTTSLVYIYATGMY